MEIVKITEGLISMHNETQTKCNGWTNYETWLVVLHYHDLLSDLAQEHTLEFSEYDEKGTYNFSQYLKNHFESCFDDIEQTKTNYFLNDIIGSALNEVNWYELAQRYEDECNTEPLED